MVIVGSLVTVFFFGGWNTPHLQDTGFLFPWGGTWALSPIVVSILGIVAFLMKVLFFCWLQLTVRWTLPRFRYDQLMNLGWKFLLPLALANVVITGFILVLID